MRWKEWVRLYGIPPSAGDGPYRIPDASSWVGKHACTLSVLLLSKLDGGLWALIMVSISQYARYVLKIQKQNVIVWSDLDQILILHTNPNCSF